MMRKTLTAILGLAALSGCAPKVSEWTPAESPKKNIVQRSTKEHVVHYPARGLGIAKIEKKRLKSFINDQLLYPDAAHVYVTEFGGHDPDRVNDIVKLLRLSGVRQNSITVDERVEEHSGHTGSGIILLVERFLVIPPACEAWTFEMGSAQGHLPISNMGCADAVNLGMMVADPRDLVAGKDIGQYDGTRQALSVEKYRADEIKELNTENTSSTGGGGSSGS